MKRYSLILAALFLLIPQGVLAGTIYEYTNHGDTISTVDTNFFPPDLGPYTTTGSWGGADIYGQVYIQNPTAGAVSGATFTLFKGPVAATATQCGEFRATPAQNTVISTGVMQLYTFDFSQWVQVNPCTLSPGDSIWVGIAHVITPNTLGTTGVSAYVVLSGDPIGDGTTRIIDNIPNDGTTIATTSDATVGTDIFLNPTDFNQGVNLVRVALTRNQNALAAVDPGLIAQTFNFPLDTSNVGFATLSTTTAPLAEGLYTMTTQIRKSSVLSNVVNFFGLQSFYDPGVVVQQISHFTAGQLTPFDIYVASSSGAFGAFGGPGTTASTSASDCALFKLSSCLSYLFIPSSATLYSYSLLGSTLAQKPPFGYFTQARQLLTSATTTSASTTLPLIAVVASTLFTPLDTIIGYLLWLALLIWVILRIARWEFQT
jgi:hypothetical protein